MLGTKDPAEISERIAGLMEKLKESEKREAAAAADKLLGSVAGALDAATEVNGTVLVTLNAGEAGSSDALRNAVLDARNRLGESKAAVVAFAGIVNDKPAVVVATNELARQNGANAGALVKQMSQILGGGGGGKPDLAQGGGQDVGKIAEALAAVAAGN
jgi:alanyl-tRNA synthetase